ncbi:Fip1 motif-domain-containing protein [Phialemonium atrogriseum]|uniref:Fip1 motif-domain-containing protein n=1 Tax=Phialemonium atrogriseum TaxID=1093897 RepID=A0AAJ0FKR1_9PEZI|nr:Fip1 motif-domain-containing protein [Phialemonium atrogriseum]KAK1765854.1 Fip1 motif-domain-containing protein [Phialemonium atrogriseum]
MDIDEDDDFYAPEEPDVQPTATAAAPAAPVAAKTESQNDELEEGEEEDESGEMDEDDDSDIDIITERKDGSKPAPPSQTRYSEIRNIPQRSTSNDATVKAAPVKKEEASKPSTSGADLPAVSTSKVDVNAIPVHKPTGKPITQVSIDEDLPENDKPWRKPGTDLSDYFNYGFDEFTWALYAQKQETLRGEYNQDAVAQNNKKMFEEMTNMMMMGGMMPGMPGGPGAGGPAAGAGAGGAAMPGMDGMPPEMQAMMQQMMASGMDPSQMDAGAMSAMFAGMQNPGGAGGAGAQGAQGQNFGAGFGGNQGQGYGYDQQGMGGGGGRGNFGGGRGRGGRRNW